MNTLNILSVLLIVAGIALMSASLARMFVLGGHLRDWTRARPRGLFALLLFLVTLAMALALTRQTMAQAYTNVYGPNFYQQFTNFPITLTAGQTLTFYGNVNNQRMVVNPTRGISFGARVHGTNNCTGDVAFALFPSIDGTTNSQTTSAAATLLVGLGNTLQKVNGTNIPPTSTAAGGNNWRDYVCGTITNPHTNSILVDNFWWTEANQ